MTRNIYTEEIKAQIIKLRGDGLLFREIAEQLNIDNLGTIHKICKAVGFKVIDYPKNRDQYAEGQRYNQIRSTGQRS